MIAFQILAFNEESSQQDDTRHWKVDGEEHAWTDDSLPFSLYYAAVNRNKRSMCLNLKHTKGKEIFFRLAKQADIVFATPSEGTNPLQLVLY